MAREEGQLSISFLLCCAKLPNVVARNAVFLSFFKKRKLRRIFRKVVNAETVESLLHGEVNERPMAQGNIQFILAFVRGENSSEVSDRIGRVADIAVPHGAVVHGMVGALVVMAFGTLAASSPETGSRSSLVEALRDQLAGDIKIVRGEADGYYGNLGGKTHLAYTFLVPHFDAILGVLSRLNYGEIEEVPRMTRSNPGSKQQAG